MTMTRPTSEQITHNGQILKDVLGPVVSVTAYGAKGDGVTDDTAAVQDAMDAGSNILFPPGTYIVRNVTVTGNKRIQGQPGAIVKLKQLASLDFSPCFNVTGGNVQFSGLEFNGNRANQPNDGFSDSWTTPPTNVGKSNRAGILMDGVPTTTLTGLSVDSCTFREFYAASIATRSVNDVSVRNCTFRDSNLEGCFLYGFTTRTTNCTVSNCTFEDLNNPGHPVVDGNGIVATLYDGVVISGNIGRRLGRNLIKLEVCNDAIVDGNVAESPTRAASGAYQAQNVSRNIVFSNNIARNLRGIGILVGGAVGTITNAVVDGNIIDGWVSGENRDGIVCEWANGVTITNNIVRNSTRTAINVSVLSDNVTVSNNRVINTTGVEVTGGGAAIFVTVLASASIDSLVIASNTCIGAQSSSSGVLRVFQDSGSPATIARLLVSSNMLTGIGAGSNYSLRSADGIIYTAGVIVDNVTDGLVEWYAGSGGRLTCRNNIGTQVITTDTTMARAIQSATSAPSTGSHRVGDIVFNSAPAAGGTIGWVCTTAGTPGTFKTFGAISA